MRERTFSPQATRRKFPGIARKHELAPRDRYQAGVWQAENRRPLVEKQAAEQTEAVDYASVALLVALLYYRRIKLQEDEQRMEEEINEILTRDAVDKSAYVEKLALLAIAAYQMGTVRQVEPPRVYAS